MTKRRVKGGQKGERDGSGSVGAKERGKLVGGKERVGAGTDEPK